MSLISHIFISSSDVSIEKRPGVETGLPNLKTNQLITARVSRVLNSHQVQLLIQGKKVSARTYVPLKAGEDVFLKVAKTGDPPILRLTEIKPENFSEAQRNWFEIANRFEPYENLSKLLEKIDVLAADRKNLHQIMPLIRFGKLIKTISLKSGNADDNFLKFLIKSSGLTWEHKLLSFFLTADHNYSKNYLKNMIDNDLKALAIKYMMDTPDSKGDNFRTMQTFAEALEKIQLFNKYTAENFGKYLLPIPIQFHETLKLGQMLIDLGCDDQARRKPENKLIKLSLLLEMSNMGKILADFSILKNAVIGLFQVADDEIRIFFEENLCELISRLNQQGFRANNIDCQTITPESLASTSLIDKIVENDSSFLNLII